MTPVPFTPQAHVREEVPETNKLFEGKRAFVTGGGSGIGRASAIALAAEGCFVTVAGRTGDSLEGTVRAINEIGGSAQAVKCDVTVDSMARRRRQQRGL
ncbi:SDR family NAD(P)-dependent oxidoreductase [Streptomyces sp. NPDC001480]|uniref:SDR family NAD(P)-dependent oxidoreductase n=1 Tax=Streptomyces sp. NPDC001480 TaxID=3364577 RepID=UPI003680D8C8